MGAVFLPMADFLYRKNPEKTAVSSFLPLTFFFFFCMIIKTESLRKVLRKTSRFPLKGTARRGGCEPVASSGYPKIPLEQSAENCSKPNGFPPLQGSAYVGTRQSVV